MKNKIFLSVVAFLVLISSVLYVQANGQPGLIELPYFENVIPPENKGLILGDGQEQIFEVKIGNPTNINYIVEWWVDNAPVNTNPINQFSFSPAQTGTYTIQVYLLDPINYAVYDKEQWEVVVSDIPVTNKFTGTILNVTPQNVNNFKGLTIINDDGMISFGNQEIDLSEVVDVDSYVRILPGVVGIDSDAFPVFKNTEAKIYFNGLNVNSRYGIYVHPELIHFPGMVIPGSMICDELSKPTCTNIEFEEEPNFSTMTMSVDISHFSTFWINTINNSAPVFTTDPQNVELDLDQLYTFQLQAVDPDGDLLSYRIFNGPAGLIIDSSTGIISWTPNQAANVSAVFGVCDGLLCTSQTHTYTVVPSVQQPTSMLAITDLDVKVGGDTDKNLDDGATIDEEAEPGDEIRFDIEIENLFNIDMDIEDIEVTITIEDIDDGDELEEEADIDDLRDGKSEDVTISFDIPYKVESGDYTVIIHVEGQDEDDVEHEVEWSLTLEVEKEDEALKITEADINKNTISCSRDIRIDIGIVNIGDDELEDVELSIRNDELGIFENTIFDLSDDFDDDDSEFEKGYFYEIEKDVESGQYQIMVDVDYEGESEQEVIFLQINDCVEKPRIDDDIIITDRNDDIDVFIKPSTDNGPTATIDTKENVTFLDSGMYVTLLTIMAIIILGAVIYAIGALVLLSKKE